MWMYALLGAGLLLVASSSKAPIVPTEQKYAKPPPIPTGLDCSRIPELSTIMAERLLPGGKAYYTKKVMRSWEQSWDAVIADWVFWELKREAGIEAPPVPPIPWADTLDRLGDPSWAWKYDGPTGSVSRRSLLNMFGPYPFSYSNWADVDCLAELKAGARSAVAKWYTQNGLG